MAPENRQWWKGSFPSWIVVALMSVIALAGARTLAEHDAVVAKSHLHGDRINMLEVAVKYQLEQIAELKSLNRTISDQLERLRDELRRRP